MKLSKNNPHADMLKQFEEWFGSCFASVLVVTINSKTVSRSRRYPVPCHLQTLNTFTSLRNKIFIFPLFKISKLSQPVNFCYWACLYFNINICISFSGTLFISLFIYLFKFYAHLLNYLLREIINAFHFLWCQFEKGQWVYRQLSFQPFWWHAMPFDQLGNHLTLPPDLCIITYPISLSLFSLCVSLFTFSS